jgi:outer membrane protein assembly factor BamB
VLAGPNVAQGVLCVGTTDTKIYGLDAATGSVRWTGAGRQHVPVQDRHRRRTLLRRRLGQPLPLHRRQNRQAALGPRARPQAALPNFSAFAPAITSPAVGNGKVFVSTNDGILHGLHVADGTHAWQIDWKKMGYSSPLFRDGKVYCALSDEGKVFCVDADTGNFHWTTETGSVIYDSGFCADATGEHVFIGNVNGTLNCLRAADGQIAWQYRMAPGHLSAHPRPTTRTSTWAR